MAVLPSKHFMILKSLVSVFLSIMREATKRFIRTRCLKFYSHELKKFFPFLLPDLSLVVAQLEIKLYLGPGWVYCLLDTLGCVGTKLSFLIH